MSDEKGNQSVNFDQSRIDEETQYTDDKSMADNEWDSLSAKQKLFDQKVKTRLRIATFIVTCIILVYLAWIFVCRLNYIEEIINIYKEVGKSDVLWFYGLSMFSIMMTFLTIATTLIYVFAFKKKKYSKKEINKTLSKLVKLVK